MIPIAVVDDPRFQDHRAEDGPHPERPERLVAVRAGLRAAIGNAWQPLPPRLARDEELATVHPASHLARLREVLGESSGNLDGDTFFNAHTETSAWLAAGGCMDLARLLVSSDVKRGFALVRPPGHHAEPDRAMGFCWLNNVALAAEAALGAGLERVAIVDWDVHHGNGTQAAFWGDPRVLFISLHQSPLYPGTGHPGEVGAGAGQGWTANLALPATSGPDAYAAAFQRVVLPLLRAQQPELILISAGFDAHARDPLASMDLDATTFGAMTAALVGLAEELGHGRLGLILEGGYDLDALETSTAAVGRALLGQAIPLAQADPGTQANRSIEQTLNALNPHWLGKLP